MPREQFVTELAETVHNMFATGISDPSAAEIAAEHFPKRALAPEIVESIRKRLHRVRDVLESDFDQPVSLLSYAYYSRFRKSPPITEADARRCIPSGHGIRAAGVRLQTNGDDDLIYQAMLAQNFSSGAGKVKKQADRVLDAVVDHRLGEPRAGSLLRRAQKEMEPENPTLQRKVMTALPGKK